LFVSSLLPFFGVSWYSVLLRIYTTSIREIFLGFLFININEKSYPREFLDFFIELFKEKI